MIRTGINLVVALTVFNHEFLKLSVSGLRNMSKNAMLVIFNDNPCRRISARDVRRLGYRGKLHIINTDKNYGAFGARIAIVEYLRRTKNNADWVMFANQDDVVLNTVPPHVSNDVYAIMGNAVTVRTRLADVLRIMDNPHDYTIDGVDTLVLAPNIGMAGTFIRMDCICGYSEFMSDLTDQINSLLSDIPFVPPIDLIMWTCFTEYMRQYHPDMSPMYMNQNNYLMTKINATHRATGAQSDAMVGRVMDVVCAALRGKE